MSTLALADGSTAELAIHTGPALTLMAVSDPGLAFITHTATATVTAADAPGTVFTAYALDTAALGQVGAGNGTGGQGTVIGGSIRYVQASPAATWSFTHPLGRPPQVTVYVADGGLLEQVDTDVSATSTLVVVSWPYPVAGELIVQ